MSEAAVIVNLLQAARAAGVDLVGLPGPEVGEVAQVAA